MPVTASNRRLPVTGNCTDRLTAVDEYQAETRCPEPDAQDIRFYQANKTPEVGG